jgi:hypothetical protein
MRQSTKDTAKGKIHEVKGKIKRRWDDPRAISAWNLKGGSKRSAGRWRRKSAKWRKVWENRVAVSLEEAITFGFL